MRKLTSKERLSGWLERRELGSGRSRIGTSKLVTPAHFILLWRYLYLAEKKKCHWNYLSMEQTFVLFAVIWGKCFWLTVRNVCFSCFRGHHEWGRYGINSFWQPCPGGKGRARIISQTNRKKQQVLHPLALKRQPVPLVTSASSWVMHLRTVLPASRGVIFNPFY